MTIIFAPHIPPALLGILIGAALLFTLYGFAIGARGTWARGFAFTALGLALANPLIVRENREPLSDVAVIVVDHSQSMAIGTRHADAAGAARGDSLPAVEAEIDAIVHEARRAADAYALP